MLDDVIREYGGVEVDAMTVYTDIFRLGENLIQKENEPKGQYKGNPVAYWKNNNEQKGHYRIMFEDTFQEVLEELQAADFAIMNGLTYYGRKNIQAAASKIYALIFDLDGVNDDRLINLLFNIQSTTPIYPPPTYVIMSGHNVHLYYVFDKPLSLYPNTKTQLKKLKFALTKKLWNRYTTELWQRPQMQGINQGFRVIGGKTKIDGVKVRAFKMYEKISIEQLNLRVSDEFKIDLSKIYTESKYTLETAKKRFPEWYERRVIQKQPKGTWQCKADLYNWWIRRIKDGENGAAVGHRYFCIMCLAIYGVKCGMTAEKVKKDAISLVPYLNNIDKSGQQPFTEHDVISALECFDERYITFPRDDISKLSGIAIQANKRNYRPQKVHLMGARAIQNINNQVNGTEWRNRDGRPTKKEIVMQWRVEHPNGTPKECINSTGVSINTVYKWFKCNMEEYEEIKQNKPLPVEIEKDLEPVLGMYKNAENMQEIIDNMQKSKK